METLDIEALFALEPGDGAVQSSPASAPSQSALDFLEQLHRRNSEALKVIILRQGWPSAQAQGEEVEAAAFMIIQHADYDPEFQRLCHTLLLRSVQAGHTKTLGFLAFLTDRILCNHGQPQRFGTQFREAENGCFVPKSIENAEHVDERRAQAQLGETLSEYLQRLNDGDLLPYRPVLNGYAKRLHNAENKVIPFPKKNDER